MRSFLFFLIILLLTIIFTSEEEKGNETKTSKNDINKNKHSKIEENKKQKNSYVKSNSKKDDKKKSKKKKTPKKPEEREELIPPPPLSFISDIPQDTYNLLNDNVYLLNDKTIDKVLQNGNNYRWLVILFSETCGHCYFARTEIRKILPDYKYSSTLRFAELEINVNPMSNMRFNIEGVPYIFILQNNTMYLMDSYPSQKNLIKFLEMDLTLFLPEEKRPFPPRVQFKRYWLDNIKNSFKEMANNLNEFLSGYGIKYEFTPFTLFIGSIIFLLFTCFLEYFCCMKYCPEEEIIQEEEKNNNEDKKEKEEKDKIRDEKKQQDNNNELKENKDISENEKIEREKEKEEKNKKEDKEEEKEKENKIIGKNNKKKKKE